MLAAAARATGVAYSPCVAFGANAIPLGRGVAELATRLCDGAPTALGAELCANGVFMTFFDLVVPEEEEARLRHRLASRAAALLRPSG